MSADLIERAKYAIDLAEACRGTDRSDWSRSERILEELAAEIVRLRGEVDGLRRELCEAQGNVYIAPAEAKGAAESEPPCSDHPDAPHGFDRNGSHNAGRYVCDCEGWQPEDTPQPAGGEAVAWVCSPAENIAQHVGINSEERQKLIDAGFDVSHYRPLVYGDTTPPAAKVQQEANYLPDRDPTKPNSEQGLYRKFYVRRTDGSDAPGGKHHGCEYFVLDVQHDPHALPAITAYANSVERTHPNLAKDLRDSGWTAHLSACELGAVRVTDEMVRAAQQREFNAPKNEPMGATVRGMIEAALQHRGDSRGGEVV